MKLFLSLITTGFFFQSSLHVYTKFLFIHLHRTFKSLLCPCGSGQSCFHDGLHPARMRRYGHAASLPVQPSDDTDWVWLNWCLHIQAPPLCVSRSGAGWVLKALMKQTHQKAVTEDCRRDEDHKGLYNKPI